jgi:glycoside hydrolase-like protein
MAAALQGLDKDVAPPAATAKRMLDAIGGRWWNVYIGGPESGGVGWTPRLLEEYAAHGIERFMLTYVGRQAGGPLTRRQGRADAHDAVQIAKGFGYVDNFPLCLDIEQHTYDSAPARAIEYARAWCATVRALGIRPGIYANPAPLRVMHGVVPADFVWVASWVSHVAGPRDPRRAPQMPAAMWPNPSQRAWQYAGAFGNTPCRVLGIDVDISVADAGVLAHAPGGQPEHVLTRVAHPRPLRPGAPKTPVRPAPSGSTKLVALVDELHRLDGATDRTWQTLAAYGRTRTNAVGQARAREVSLRDVRAILLRIEHTLMTFVDVERTKRGASQPEETAASNGNGAKPASSAPLHDLPDEELLRRIERLDLALERARSLMIARYVQREQTAEPARNGRHGTAAVPKAIPATDPVRNLQRVLNEFSARYLEGLAPLVVDGQKGPATKQRIRAVKHYLGYTGPAGTSSAVDQALVRRSQHPRSVKHSSPTMLARAAKRRRAQRKNAQRSLMPRAGVATFDGRPVAAWLKPYLVWARAHGWQGTLTSGFRDPLYSEHLCKLKCGAPTCSGTCAGRTSNHSGRIKPAGAIDVTHPGEFAKLMLRCPLRPRLRNDLPRDRVHFSVTGH